MTRRPREQPQGFFHVRSRGVDGREIFTFDDMRLQYLRCLAKAVLRRGIRCHRYCLMDNHVHLVIETLDEEKLAAAMQLVNSAYARIYNEHVGRRGYLFERPYESTLLRSERHTLEVLRYVDLNPVRAGKTPRAVDHLWSSYRPTVGVATKPAFLTIEWTLSLFGVDSVSAQLNYAQFVAEGAEWRGARRVA